jgi:hypothetical protein
LPNYVASKFHTLKQQPEHFSYNSQQET